VSDKSDIFMHDYTFQRADIPVFKIFFYWFHVMFYEFGVFRSCKP